MRFQRSLEAILLDSRAEQVARPGNRIAAQREMEGGRARAVIESAAVRRRLKAERRERIAELRRQGETVRVIARRLGLSERQVYDLSSAFPVQP